MRESAGPRSLRTRTFGRKMRTAHMLRSRPSHRRSRILAASEVIQRQEHMMDHRDPSLWRRLPGPEDPVPEGQAGGGRARARHHGLRQVRRLSNWTAVGLVAATAVTAGYFARASTSTSASTTTGHQQVAPVSGSHSKAPASSSKHACTTAVTTAVTAPVAVSGGSGVTVTVPSRPPRYPARARCPARPRCPARHAPPARVAGSRPPWFTRRRTRTRGGTRDRHVALAGFTLDPREHRASRSGRGPGRPRH